MKKFLISLLSFGMFAFSSVSAGVLNWQIGGTSEDVDNPIEYNAIRVTNTATDEKYVISTTAGAAYGALGSNIYSVGNQTTDSVYNFAINFDGEQSASYDFYIELFKVDANASSLGNKVGWETVSLDSLQGYVSNSWNSFSTTSVVTASSITPEPTSGLLLLMGGALLALRRKRA